MYATNTTVNPERSQEEIKRTLRKYGAERFGVMEDREKSYVMFQYENLYIQMIVPMPDRNEYIKTDTGRDRTEKAVDTAYEQAIRQRWRALLLAIKAKLEAVELGISTVEQEFLPYVVMPDGKPLHEHIIPKIRQAAKTGKMPKLLPSFSEKEGE